MATKKQEQKQKYNKNWNLFYDHKKARWRKFDFEVIQATKWVGGRGLLFWADMK